MRWIHVAMITGGLAAVSAGLYLGSPDDDSSNVARASQAANPTLTATRALPTATVTASPGVTVSPSVTATVEPTATAEPEPTAPVPEPTAAPALPPAAPIQLAAPTATAVPPTPVPPPPPATATPVPPPPPAAPAAPVNLAGLEQSMLAAHNAERAAVGLSPLQIDGTLTSLARVRAQDMAVNNYFAHTSPSGQTAFGLLQSSGYPYSLAGENLARNNYPDSQSVGMAMTGFMGSPSHRVNVLDPSFRYVGIGLAVAADGLKYYAVIFAAP